MFYSSRIICLVFVWGGAFIEGRHSFENTYFKGALIRGGRSLQNIYFKGGALSRKYGETEMQKITLRSSQARKIPLDIKQ